MDFFKNFAELIPGADVQLTIKEKNGTFAILILPNLGTKSSIKPLEVNGTAAELDQDFFKIITTPLQQASAVVTNAKEFASSVQEAVKEDVKPEKKEDKSKKDNQPDRTAAREKAKKKGSQKAKTKKQTPIKKEQSPAEEEKSGPQELKAF